MFGLFKKQNQPTETKATNNKVTFQELLDIKDIRVRRPSNGISSIIEQTILDVLSSQEDKGGKKLVQLVSYIFNQLGYHTKINDGFNDKKQDVLIFQNKDDDKPILVIQCKSYSPQNTKDRIKIGALSDFVAYTEDYKDCRMFLTTSYFYPKTIEDFADRVILVDRIGFIALLSKAFPIETANVMNTLSLHDIKENCKECRHGKLQLLFFNNIPNFKCTNCATKYKAVNRQPVLYKREKY